MDEKLEKLRQLGCDVDEAIGRFLGDKELYFVCFNDLLGDSNFDKLGETLREGDSVNAIHYAHTLKSVYANMGLTPIYNDCFCILRSLRAGESGEQLLDRFGNMQEFMDKIRQI